MSVLVQRPIIKSWAEDSTNKDAPSQTAIGEGINYASPIISSEPNGANFIIYEAVKYLQRTGGLYGPTIPYSKGQSASIVRNILDRYAVEDYVFIGAVEATGQPPITGATVSDSNGVPVYSGGLVNTAYWQDAKSLDGYDPLVPEFSVSVAAFASVQSSGKQYVNVTASSRTDLPSARRDYYMKSPSLDEILQIMDGLYYPKWAAMADSIATYPIRRLGSYIYNGARVEAFGHFINGAGFTDNGSNDSSKFWRSFDAAYAGTLCIIRNTSHRDIFMPGVSGGAVSPRNYIGRVACSEGTPILTVGTADARAALGAVQDDQMQGITGHIEGPRLLEYTGFSGEAGALKQGVSSSLINAGAGGTPGTKQAIDFNSGLSTGGGLYGTARAGYSTRENTFSQPVPMLVSLLPYGQITL